MPVCTRSRLLPPTRRATSDRAGGTTSTGTRSLPPRRRTHRSTPVTGPPPPPSRLGHRAQGREGGSCQGGGCRPAPGALRRARRRDGRGSSPVTGLRGAPERRPRACRAPPLWLVSGHERKSGPPDLAPRGEQQLRRPITSDRAAQPRASTLHRSRPRVRRANGAMGQPGRPNAPLARGVRQSRRCSRWATGTPGQPAWPNAPLAHPGLQRRRPRRQPGHRDHRPDDSPAPPRPSGRTPRPAPG
jgi:hypothetical protein